MKRLTNIGILAAILLTVSFVNAQNSVSAPGLPDYKKDPFVFVGIEMHVIPSLRTELGDMRVQVFWYPGEAGSSYSCSVRVFVDDNNNIQYIQVSEFMNTPKRSAIYGRFQRREMGYVSREGALVFDRQKVTYLK